MIQRVVELVLSQSLVSVIVDCIAPAFVLILLLLLLLLSVAGTPTDVTAKRTDYTSVLVSWTAPSPPPTGYEVFYQTSAGDQTRLSGGDTSNTELTLTGLTLGETYSIFVVAFGKEGAPVLPSSHSETALICELYTINKHIQNSKLIQNNINYIIIGSNRIQQIKYDIQST